jgi:hypothetical protein
LSHDWKFSATVDWNFTVISDRPDSLEHLRSLRLILLSAVTLLRRAVVALRVSHATDPRTLVGRG